MGAEGGEGALGRPREAEGSCGGAEWAPWVAVGQSGGGVGSCADGGSEDYMGLRGWLWGSQGAAGAVVGRRWDGGG